MLKKIRTFFQKNTVKTETPSIKVNISFNNQQYDEDQYIYYTQLGSVEPEVFEKFWKKEFDAVVLDYWNEYGWWGPLKVQEQFKEILGTKKYEEFIKYADAHLKEQTPWGKEVTEFRQGDISAYARKILIDVHKKDIQNDKPINMKKCKLCDSDFNCLDISATYTKFKPKKWDICENCVRTCLYQSPKLKKAEMGDKLKNLAIILDDQIPPNNFKSPSVIREYLTPSNHVEIFRVLKETPDYSIYIKKFGSYFKALIDAKLLDNNSRKTARGTQCLAIDGHECLSISEKIIDDWMHKNGIKHSKEPMYPKDVELNPNGLMRGDWLVNGEVFVEYFGLKGDPDYDNKILLKEQLAKKYKVTIIGLYHKDIKNLKKILGNLKKMTLLTKSKFMNGLQCPRLLWHSNKKLLPEVSISDKHKFAQGHEFEKYVYKLFPEGVSLVDMDFSENLEKTSKLIQDKKIIFEAGIQHADYYIRADILRPNEDGWDLIEIKSTSSVKKEHIPDLAFQKYVCEKAGLKITKCFVYFLNKEFVKKGEIKSEDLVSIEDVSEQVELVVDIEKNANNCFKVMALETYDEVPIGQHCNNPHECPLKKQCWSTLPENNVIQLTNWRVYWKLIGEGIQDIKDIPAGTKLSAKDEIIIDSLKKSPYISKEHIKHFLDSLHYPLYHFDFETFDTAVPIFDKSRPYQKIPFQYSLHIEQKNGMTEHKEFLYEGNQDPRPSMLEQMKKDLEGTGDIIVFNKSFEISVMRKLSEDFPEHNDWLQQAIDRIVDLADPFRAFYYYDKSQKGSYSIKKVLPAITGKSYSELEINNGADASMLYFYSHIYPEIKERDKIRENLYKYCKLDTEGMVWIINKLKKI